MTDLPGVPEDETYSELSDLVREYLETKSEEISQGGWKVEQAEDTFLAVLTTGNDGTPVYKYREDTDLVGLPITAGEFPGEVGEKLFSYLDEKSDQEITTSFLKRLYIDAFGRNADDLDQWEEKLPEIEENIKKDLNNLSRVNTVQSLQGVECEEGDVTFGDGIRVILPQKGDEYAVSSGGPSANRDLHMHSLVEFSCTQRSHERFAKKKSLDTTKKVRRTLQLYGRQDVETITVHQEPETYRPNFEFRENPDPQLTGKFTITPEDQDSIDNLYSLISSYFDEKEREFQPPIHVALDHFETAVSPQTNHSSSITFSIIGLESLYKHYTEGESSSKFIHRYIAFTLSKAVPHLEVGSVKKTIEDAYGIRHDTVHGETIDRRDHGDALERVLDYLRYSIVIFGLLKRDYAEQYKPSIDDSMIDDTARQELVEVLDKIDLSDYLLFEPS